ncbi:Atg2 protein [Saccharomycopsis crataegensis]|uniref:Autophagy-related protein 2 n=1 Tax=Saccharomycopsis crataegensis TaxID=43959 RepID=A0AAV5QIY6_9ASCO|nr:Atg2 protein [Saccharomycopsis crataegensis]
MSPQWMPQNIQKRLLRYILQQLSVFSEIDLSDLDVSLGVLSLKNVALNPESFSIPGAFLRSGQISDVNLQLTTDGIVVKCTGVEVILVLATGAGTSDSSKKNGSQSREFSLAKSRNDLANSVMGDLHGDEVSTTSSGTSSDENESGNNDDDDNRNETNKKKKETTTFYSSYVNRAVELALSKLQVVVENVLVKVIIDDNGTSTSIGGSNGQQRAACSHFFLQLDKVSWDYTNEKNKAVNVEGFKMFTELSTVNGASKEKAKQNPRPDHHSSPKKFNGLGSVLEEPIIEPSNNMAHSDDEDSDQFNSDDEGYNQMMASSFLPNPKDEGAPTDQDSDGSDDADTPSTMFLSANSHLSQTMMMTLNKLKEERDDFEDEDDKNHSFHSSIANLRKSSLKTDEQERIFNSIYETATGSGTMNTSQFSIMNHSKQKENKREAASFCDERVDERRYFFAISSLVLRFAGLLEFEDLEVIIEQVNISFKDYDNEDDGVYASIFDVALNFIKQFDKINKLNSYLIKRKKAKMRGYSNLANGNGGNVTIGKSKSQNGILDSDPNDEYDGKDKLSWFSRMCIKELSVNFDDYILPDGTFKSSDELLLKFSNINVNKKNQYLIYGGIEKLEMINSQSQAFGFSSAENEPVAEVKQEELRFEYMMNQHQASTAATDITVLFSKIASLKLNSQIIGKLLGKFYKISPVLDALTKLQSTLDTNNNLAATNNYSSQFSGKRSGLSASLVFQKPGGGMMASSILGNSSHIPQKKSALTVQSNSIHITLEIEENQGLYLEILPINYCSSTQRLNIPKMLIYEINKMKSSIATRIINDEGLVNKDNGLIAMISNISLTGYSKKPHHQITSFDINNKEIMYSTDSVLNIDSVIYSEEFSSLMDMIEMFKRFAADLPKPKSVTMISEPSNPSYISPVGRTTRKVRMTSTVSFSNPGSSSNVKMHVNISKIKTGINGIKAAENDPSSLFGDIVGSIDTVHVNIFNDSVIQILVKKVSLFRFYGSMRVNLFDLEEGSLDHQNINNVKSRGVEEFFTSDEFGFDGKNFDGLEQLVGISNPEDDILPVIGIRFSNNSGRGFVRNLAINYYAAWLSIFDKKNNAQPQESSIPKTASDNNSPTSLIKLRVVDCVIGLNPSRLHSKAMLMVNRGDLDIHIGNDEFFTKAQLRNISMLLIDDTDNILSYSETKKRRQWSGTRSTKKKPPISSQGGSNTSSIPSWSQLSWNLSRGFISVGTFNSLNLLLVRNSEIKLYKMPGCQNPVIDLKIDADICSIELCADSSQTLTQLFADLKEPVILSDEEKFKVSINDEDLATNTQDAIGSKGIVNIFDDIDENAFGLRKSLHETVLFNRNNEGSDSELDLESDGEADENNGGLNFVDDYYEGLHNSSSVSSSKQSSESQSSNQKIANDILSRSLSTLNVGKKRDPLSKNTFYYNESFGSNNEEDMSSNSSLSFAANHFNTINDNYSDTDLKARTVPVKVHLILGKINILLYDGYDWPDTRSAIKKVVRMVEKTGLKAFNDKVARNDNGATTKNNTLISDEDMAEEEENISAINENYLRSAKKLKDKRNRRDSLGDFGFRPFGIDDDDDDTMRDINEFDGAEEDNSDEEEDNDNFYPGYGDPQIIDHMLFDSIHISLPAGANPDDLAVGINKIIGNSDVMSTNSTLPSAHQKSREAELVPDQKTNYRKLNLRRSKSHKLSVDITELELDCIIHCNTDPVFDNKTLRHQELEDDSELLLSLSVKIKDFEIIDHVPTSTWNKFATYMKEAGDREVGVGIINFDFATYRPVASLAATESTIKVNVLPLRLHVDQDALEFLTRFGGFKDKRFMFDEIYDDILYIQKFQINSVHLKLDYKPKKVDYFGIRSGNTTEFVNFFILDGAKITLKKLTLYGIPGMPRLNDELNALWMPDIRSTQLKGIISGLTPSLSKIGEGIKDLMVIPVNEYKKDGRVGNSLQKGAYAFVRTTTNELLRFGVKIAAGTQTVLENTEEALGGAGSSARLPKRVHKQEFFETKDDDHYDRIKSKSKNRVTDVSVMDMRGSMYAGGGGNINNNNSEARTRRRVSSSTTKSKGYSGSRYYSEVYSDSEDDELLDISENESEDEDYDTSEQQRTVSLYADQPIDAKQGLNVAVTSLERNFLLARDAVVKAGGDASESGSAKKALYVMAKAAPVALIRPMIGTTEAISKTLLGVTNQINPEQGLEAKEKYKAKPR